MTLSNSLQKNNALCKSPTFTFTCYTLRDEENSFYLLLPLLHISHFNSFSFSLLPSTTRPPVVSQSIWCCNTVGLLWPHFPRCICGYGLSRELIGWRGYRIDQPLLGVRSAWCTSEVCPNSTHHWLPVFLSIQPINLPSSVVFGNAVQSMFSWCIVLFINRISIPLIYCRINHFSCIG